MELGELRDFIAPESLALVIGGNTYEVPLCKADDWARMQVVRDELIDQGDDFAIKLGDLWDMTLGDARHQMFNNGVRQGEVNRAAWTAFYWHLGFEDMARTVWAGGEQQDTTADDAEDVAGKAQAPASAKTKPATRSRRTAGATTTRSAASTSGTKASRKS